MRVQVKVRWQPKAGNRSSDYEDAFCPYWFDAARCGPAFRFAVADGATESSFARLWARLLVLLYCNPHVQLPPVATDEFVEQVGWLGRVWERQVYSQPLEWFALAKAERGSFSSLVGLTLEAGGDRAIGRGSWQATAVGDSCLFHLRGDRLLLAAPISDPAEFGHHPRLISTNPARNHQVWQDLDRDALGGEWAAGDQFLLMTDALACWFLTRVADGGQPWRSLDKASRSHAHFAQWLHQRRAATEIRNDDVTLLTIRL